MKFGQQPRLVTRWAHKQAERLIAVTGEDDVIKGSRLARPAHDRDSPGSADDRSGRALQLDPVANLVNQPAANAVSTLEARSC